MESGAVNARTASAYAYGEALPGWARPVLPVGAGAAVMLVMCIWVCNKVQIIRLL